MPRYRLRLALLMIAILAGAGAQHMMPHNAERVAHTSPAEHQDGPAKKPSQGKTQS